MSSSSPQTLRQALADAFSIAELNELCVDLGIDPESIPGRMTSKVVYATQIVIHFQQRHSLPQLVKHCAELRPQVAWLSLQVPAIAPTDLEAIGHTITNIDTNGGANVGRDVNANIFIGRDNNVTNITVNHPLSREKIVNPQSLAKLRKAVRAFWIDGILNKSIFNEALIQLNMTKQSSAVNNRPWNLAVQEDAEEIRSLPPGTHIIDVFDQMDQGMLILGEPGSGKTTTMLELARELLDRVDSDESLPSPVILNLSSWAEDRKPLAQWIAFELKTRYPVTKKDAQIFVKNDHLLLLLDGLDEVEQKYRAVCIDAINDFREQHMIPLVVCSRFSEYEALKIRLKLQGAVLLEQLTIEQIDDYLDQVGIPLSALHAALQQDIELQELARSPLALSIMTLAYQNASIEEVSNMIMAQNRRQLLFDNYIKRMFLRPSREIEPIFSSLSTICWLHWLATRLVIYGQSIFLIEQIQPTWLATDKKINAVTYSPAAIVFLTIFLLVWWSGWISFNTHNGFLFGGIVAAIGIGFLSLDHIQTVDGLNWSWSRAKLSILSINSRLRVALIILPFATLVAGFLTWIASRLVDVTPVYIKAFLSVITALIGIITFALVIYLIFALCFLLVFMFIRGFRRIELTTRTQPNEGIFRSLASALVSMVACGTVIGLFVGLIGGTFGGRNLGLAIGLPIGLVIGLICGVVNGGYAVVQHFVLRFVLTLNGFAPMNYANFLDHAAALIFLRKVGGGYIFIHRLIMEHFAGLTDVDIRRIANSVEATGNKKSGLRK